MNQLFHIGQEVTPVYKEGTWQLEEGESHGIYPVWGEIYTVIDYIDGTHIVLKELSHEDSWQQEYRMIS